MSSPSAQPAATTPSIDLTNATCTQLTTYFSSASFSTTNSVNTPAQIPTGCDLTFGGLSVGAPLNLAPGAHLHLHDLTLTNQGRLMAQGTAAQPVTISITGSNCNPISLNAGSNFNLAQGIIEQTGQASCSPTGLFSQPNNFISGAGTLPLSSVSQKNLPTPTFNLTATGQTLRNISFATIPFDFSVSLDQAAAIPGTFTYDSTGSIVLLPTWGSPRK